MKNAIKTTISFILVLFVSFSSLAVCFATDTNENITESMLDEYVYINRNTCSISISGINANMSAKIESKTSTSLYIKMELQKVKSGVYSTIDIYETSSSGISITLNKTRMINALATYRLKVTFTAGTETAVSYAYP